MMPVLRRFGLIAVIAVLAIYAVVELRGPHGIPALLEKRRQIRELEDQNATLVRENVRKRDRIQRLKSSASEQEMEIRKRLKLLRPGETQFILPETPAKQPAPPSSAAQ